MFARKTSEPLASLVKKIDEQIGKNDELKSFVVILSNEDAAPDGLRKMAKDASISHVPLTVHGDAAEVPDYAISKKADVTVVMWRGGKVKASLGFKGELTEDNIRTILADLPKILSD